MPVVPRPRVRRRRLSPKQEAELLAARFEIAFAMAPRSMLLHLAGIIPTLVRDMRSADSLAALRESVSELEAQMIVEHDRRQGAQ